MRRPDWEPRLRAVLDDWQRRDCSRAAHCGDFAADVLEAVTGRDVRASIAARTPADVAAVYRRHGARCLSDVVSAILGEPVPVRQARRGDIVKLAADPALGVCVGDRVAALYHGGLAMLPISAAAHAWHL